MLGKPLRGLTVKQVLVEEALDIDKGVLPGGDHRPHQQARRDHGERDGRHRRRGSRREIILTTSSSCPIDPAYGPMDFEIRDVMSEAGFDSEGLARYRGHRETGL